MLNDLYNTDTPLNLANQTFNELATPCLKTVSTGFKRGSFEDAPELWTQLAGKLSEVKAFSKRFTGSKTERKTCPPAAPVREDTPYRQIVIKTDESTDGSIQNVINKLCNDGLVWNIDKETHKIDFGKDTEAESFKKWLGSNKAQNNANAYMEENNIPADEVVFKWDNGRKKEKLADLIPNGTNFFTYFTMYLKIPTEGRDDDDVVKEIIERLKKDRCTLTFYVKCGEDAKEKTCYYAYEDQQYVCVTLNFKQYDGVTKTQIRKPPKMRRYKTLIGRKEASALTLETRSGETKTFELTGMVLQGIKPDHYNARIKTKDSWYEVDDDSVTPLTGWAHKVGGLARTAKEKNFVPYMLFYSTIPVSTSKPVGLKNIRNICYANALLQNIANFPELLQDLEENSIRSVRSESTTNPPSDRPPSERSFTSSGGDSAQKSPSDSSDGLSTVQSGDEGEGKEDIVDDAPAPPKGPRPKRPRRKRPKMLLAELWEKGGAEPLTNLTEKRVTSMDFIAAMLNKDISSMYYSEDVRDAPDPKIPFSFSHYAVTPRQIMEAMKIDADSVQLEGIEVSKDSKKKVRLVMDELIYKQLERKGELDTVNEVLVNKSLKYNKLTLRFSKTKKAVGRAEGMEYIFGRPLPDVTRDDVPMCVPTANSSRRIYDLDLPNSIEKAWESFQNINKTLADGMDWKNFLPYFDNFLGRHWLRVVERHLMKVSKSNYGENKDLDYVSVYSLNMKNKLLRVHPLEKILQKVIEGVPQASSDDTNTLFMRVVTKLMEINAYWKKGPEQAREVEQWADVGEWPWPDISDYVVDRYCEHFDHTPGMEVARLPPPTAPAKVSCLTHSA